MAERKSATPEIIKSTGAGTTGTGDPNTSADAATIALPKE